MEPVLELRADVETLHSNLINSYPYRAYQKWHTPASSSTIPPARARRVEIAILLAGGKPRSAAL